MTIPIKNIYYLLAYAWDHAQHEDLTRLESIQGPDVLDLLGLLLARHVERIVRRGMGRSYEETTDDLSSVRGRLLTHDAQFGLGVKLCRVRCRFDEMDVDTPQNQLLKATMLALIRRGELDASIREDLIGLSRWFHEISDARVTRRMLSSVPRHRNNRSYHFPIQICRLVWECFMPTEKAGEGSFVDFVRDEKKMAALWEEFLRSFLRRHAAGWTVGGRKMAWAGQGVGDDAHQLLPQLRTDIELSRPGRRRILDAKYTVAPLVTGQYGNVGLKSGHLYQILAYAHNALLQQSGSAQIEASLIYAGVGAGFTHQYVLQGIPLTVKAVDLRQDWCAIEGELCSFIHMAPQALSC